MTNYKARNRFLMSTYHNGSVNGNEYNVIGCGVGASNATETLTDIATVSQYILTRIQLVSISNTKNGNTLNSLSIDTVATEALTVAAAATGEYDSGLIAIVIPTGAKLTMESDTTASSTGSRNIATIIELAS